MRARGRGAERSAGAPFGLVPEMPSTAVAAVVGHQVGYLFGGGSGRRLGGVSDLAIATPFSRRLHRVSLPCSGLSPYLTSSYGTVTLTGYVKATR
jgi:hypothetical protein